MALHGLSGCATDDEAAVWRIACKCGARFSSYWLGLATEAYRSHMAEPALDVARRVDDAIISGAKAPQALRDATGVNDRGEVAE